MTEPPIGGTGNYEMKAFASEVKGLLWLNSDIHVFPPGHIYDSYVDDFVYSSLCTFTHSEISVPVDLEIQICLRNLFTSVFLDEGDSSADTEVVKFISEVDEGTKRVFKVDRSSF